MRWTETCMKHILDNCFGFNTPWWWESNTAVHFLRYGSSLQRSCSTSNSRTQRKLTCLSGSSNEIDRGCTYVLMRYFQSCSEMTAPNQTVMFAGSIAHHLPEKPMYLCLNEVCTNSQCSWFFWSTQPIQCSTYSEENTCANICAYDRPYIRVIINNQKCMQNRSLEWYIKLIGWTRWQWRKYPWT